MKNGWTGGQYSVFRLLLGLYVAYVSIEFALLSADAGHAVLFLGGVLGVILALGVLDRAAAAVCVCLLLGWGVVTYADPLRLFLVLPLLMHCLVPPAPYGSWKARGRPDPGGGWRFPPVLFLVVRVLILGLFLWSGIQGLGAVPWEFSGTWFLLTFMLFNPDWVRPRIGSGKATMFYDGECALCHGGVRFILAEDRFDSIRFAPLQSEIFKERLTATERERMGDTVVFETETGELLSRSTAIASMLQRLGGLWRIAGVLLRLIPRPLRDFAYDLVARTRYRVFGRKKEYCPLIPPELRGRFDL